LCYNKEPLKQEMKAGLVMNFVVLLNSILRLPLEKARKVFEDYQKNVGFKNFYEQQRVLDMLTEKAIIQRQIKDEAIVESFLYLGMMTKRKKLFSEECFEIIKKYPMIIWIEFIGSCMPQDIMALLNNYAEELPSSLIETCIINLPTKMQLIALDKYKNKLDSEGPMFGNFYYSVDKVTRKKLKEYFPEQIEDDILLELQDLEENEMFQKLLSEEERLKKRPSDDLIEFILLKAQKVETLNKFLELYKDKVNECSTEKFKLLFTRYRYLSMMSSHYDDFEDEEDEEIGEREEILKNSDLFKLFKEKFHLLGLEETLSLFDEKASYGSEQFTVEVVLGLLDIAYADCDIADYINEATIIEAITKFVEKCRSQEYSIDAFEELVKKIEVNGKQKLIFDDYIEAIIACGKLLKNGTINNQNPLFLELRGKFTEDLINRIQKDGTYLEKISLNGIFYRLAKGSIPFDKVYLTKTYKGLIYLSKCGEVVENADYITNFLTDEQLAKLNIKPVIRWKKEIHRTNTKADNLSFVERMGLQLLTYFGNNRGRYLLESDMQGNRMENLFDGLRYENITVNEKGEANINQELIRYLFGKGMMKEPNSVINRMMRGEIPEFEKYFTEFCNTFEEIQKACNGVLSVKRIIRYFENIDFPIELKPDEVEMKDALREMNTTDRELLYEAIGLCKDARSRENSSIPKVEGRLGDFTYRILNLDDPLAVAVGYLSHCCFVVQGISYSALKHSMQSSNGRTFVVYYQGKFLTQSWVWRNGDVICFDSVEAGSAQHGMYKDDIKLVDVYQQAAREMLYISAHTEDELQKIKVVTVGKSDYEFRNLISVEIPAPRPLEKDIYVYDSSRQQILAGKMPDKPNYGEVGVQYQDPRKKAIIINDVTHADIDILDEIEVNINSLKYQIYQDESPLDYSNYSKIISGDGWYILIQNDGTVESGTLEKTEETVEEYNQYLSNHTTEQNKLYTKKLKPFDNKR